MKSLFNILRFYIIMIILGLFPQIKNIILEEVRMATKEVMYSYYMRGRNAQFGPRTYFSPPEDITEQNLNFFVCTSFPVSVYMELLNVTFSGSQGYIFGYADQNIGKKPEVIAFSNIVNNKIEMKVYSPNDENGYRIIIDPTFEELLNLVEAGDILIQTGHYLTIYDIITDNNGQRVDAIVMEALSLSGRTYIKTKVSRDGNTNPKGDEYKRHFYGDFLHGNFNSDFKGIQETLFRVSNFSKYLYWANMTTMLNFREANYAIFRIVQSDSNGQAIFRYNDTFFNFFYKSNFTYGDMIKLSENNLARIKFKHLYIEKTVNEHNGGIVEIGDFLVYKIKIKNCWEKNYEDDLFVVENLSKFVTFESQVSNKTTISFENNMKSRQLKWNLGKLKSGEELTLYYIVRVTSGNKNDTIENIGFVGNIKSSTVRNIIGNNLNKKQKNSIKKNFETLKKDYNGKKLINEIYKKSFNIDIKFDEFDIKDLILNKKIDSSDINTVELNQNNSFYNSILNRYWSTLTTLKHTYIQGKEEVNIYIHKGYQFFDGKDGIRRADFVHEKMLKTGDILIYINRNDIVYSVENNQLKKNYITYENGEYAYIYIEGKGFIGVNLGDDGIADTLDDRNEFTAKYYKNNNLELCANCNDPSDEFLQMGNLLTVFGKDYYVILRPSLCFNFPNIKSSKVSLIVFFITLGIFILTFGFFILYKCYIMKKNGKELNFNNLQKELLFNREKN